MKENNFKNLNSECHTRPDRVSRGMIFNNKEYHTAGSSGSADAAPRMTESGRSMVEMLGVLAVIGVLSVAGVGGYTAAMKRHRANELINEANKRAVVLAMQIAQGKTGTLSIDEFINNKIGTAEFKNPTYATGADTFTMTLTGVNEAVCNQMKTTAGENGALKIEGTCGDSLTLTFTKDLSSGGDSSEPELGLKQNVPCGTGFCYEGQTCTDGACIDAQNNSCPISEPIYDGIYYNECFSCHTGGIVINTSDGLICCNKETGQSGSPAGWESTYNANVEFKCCEVAGGWTNNDLPPLCCKEDGYTINGIANTSCKKD